jgi:hypothetical protein
MDFYQNYLPYFPFEELHIYIQVEREGKAG